MYIKAISTGKGFVTHEDREAFDISGIGHNLWEVQDNAAGQAWVTRVGGEVLTKEEAEDLINMMSRQNWIAKTRSGTVYWPAPALITL